jgi:hypothetical protein
MEFGCSFFHRPATSRNVALILELLSCFAEKFRSEKCQFQGYLSDDDRFTRLRRISGKALQELASDLEAGKYTIILAHAGGRESEAASLTIDVNAGDGSCDLATIDFTAALERGSVDDGVSFAYRIWCSCRPAYGFSIWGNSPQSLMSELKGIPISSIYAPLDATEEARLFRIQAIRRSLGCWARGDAWGTYLGPAMVDLLRQNGRDPQTAPVAVRSALPEGYYLQVSEDPLLVGADVSMEAAKRLEEFLRPLIDPDPNALWSRSAPSPHSELE